MRENPQLHRAATWFAHHGLHVFPLSPGTKIPLKNSGGLLDATTDTEQVDRWWRQNPNYNIGLACGPSGIVVVDFDTYKSGVNIDILFDDDDLVNTVMSRTPRGGTHVWFRQPQGMAIGSHTDKPYDDVDVRGHGGYIVAPPSITDDGRYVFFDDHRPTDVAGVPLPSTVAEMLTPEPPTPRPASRLNAQEAHSDEIRDALRYLPTQMDYEAWRAILMAVHSIYPDELGVSLCEEWSPGYPGEIAKKFKSFRKGGVTIATLFGMARAHGWRPLARPSEPNDTEDVRSRLTRLSDWIHSGDCNALLKEKGVRRVADIVAVLIPLVGIAIERGSTRVFTSAREFGRTYGIGYQAVVRRIEKLNEMGLIKAESTPKGTWVDLSPLHLDPGETLFTSNGESVSPGSTSLCSFQSNHAGDDAFASYPYWYAAARRDNGNGQAPLMTNLGSTGWLLWTYLEKGGTIKDIAEESQLSIASVRAAVKRFLSCGLVTEEELGREKYYRLKLGAEETLDDVRPHMVTYGVNQMRGARSHADTARFADIKLRGRRKMSEREVAFWERVRDESNEIADRHFDFLDSQGFDARKKVGKERPITKGTRGRMNFDFVEEWRTWGRPLFDTYNALGDISREEKIRLLTLARSSDSDSDGYYRIFKQVREEVETMLMMAPKRVKYERKGDEMEVMPVRLGYTQLVLEIPHG